MTMTKQEARRQIRKELECPKDFVDRCLDDDLIEEYRKAAHEHDRSEIMSCIFEDFRDYCAAWDLDYQDDNRRFKPILCI